MNRDETRQLKHQREAELVRCGVVRSASDSNPSVSVSFAKRLMLWDSDSKPRKETPVEPV